jgi:hypothetical protein
VLVNQAPRSLSGEAAVAEKSRLDEAITGLRRRAIVLPYTDQAMLAGHLNNMLSMAAGKAAGSASGDACTERSSGRRWRLATRRQRALPTDRQQGAAQEEAPPLHRATKRDGPPGVRCVDYPA